MTARSALLCLAGAAVALSAAPALAQDGATVTNAPLEMPKPNEPASVSVDATGRSIIMLSSACSAFEIAFRKGVGVSVSCSKPPMGASPWTAPIKDYAIVRVNASAQILVAKSDDPVLGRLSFSALSQEKPQPILTFASEALDGLTSLARLFFDRVDFTERNVSLTLSSRLTDLVFQFTNAEDVSIASVDPKTSSLAALTLSYTDFSVLPAVLYQRKYSSGLQVQGLEVVPKTQKIQRLNSVYYANAVENLKGVNRAGFNLTGDCSASTPELEKSISVCLDATLPIPTEAPVKPIDASVNNMSSAPVPLPTASTKSSSSNGLTTGLGIGSAVVVLALVAALLVFRRRRQTTEESENDSPMLEDPSVKYVDDGTAATATTHSATATKTGRTAHSDQTATFPGTRDMMSPTESFQRGVHLLVEHPSVRQLRISMQHLVVGKQISRGAFGVVHQGVYMERAVAIKRLTPVLRGDLEETTTFIAEAKLVAAMRHDRIIQFIGLAWDTPFDVHLVTEFMSGGDLRNVLAKYQQSNAPTGFNRMKIRIALHVAEALTYLHSLRPQVLHRDLKSRNVLLSTEMDAKLIDFGVSRKSADHTMTACVGTLRWMAPEVIQGGRYDERADVFSFGVVLSELDTHTVPYSQNGEPMPDGVVITKVSMGQLQASFSPQCDPVMLALARQCMAFESADRPSAEEVLSRLRQFWLEFRGD
ncbi:hypothetical protein PINS_up010333 [Pythium insidiosum]|nr:hypothetical protein PINS_up010333 [Pythium insidiosum]